MRSATHCSGTPSAFGFVCVTMSALAVMPGRSVWGGFAMAILISNSVFCSAVPLALALALLLISDTWPWSGSDTSASAWISDAWPLRIATMSFSSTLTCASISERSAMIMMTSAWNCDPSAISPASLLSSLTVPAMGA